MRAVCGLDVHKDTVYLCILCETGEIFENVYGVLTCELKNMCREMRRREVTEVTMESTATYWIPIWRVLEPHFRLKLVNPYFIKQLPGRPEYMVGAHCLNHNAHSIGVCYEGGLDIRGQPADTRTVAQKASLRRLLADLHRRYPHARIIGHHDLNPQKACPCIENVAKEYADLQP